MVLRCRELQEEQGLDYSRVGSWEAVQQWLGLPKETSRHASLQGMAVQHCEPGMKCRGRESAQRKWAPDPALGSN